MDNRYSEEDKKVILTIKSLIDHCDYVYDKSIIFKNKDNFLAADEMYRDVETYESDNKELIQTQIESALEKHNKGDGK